VRVPSEVAAIEEAVEVLTRHCLAGAPSSASLRFRLQTALAEALANAVLRGNQSDLRKGVHVVVELEADVVRVHVGDEGDGFDLSRMLQRQPVADADGGRGLLLLHALADALQFNERGNALCMTLRRH